MTHNLPRRLQAEHVMSMSPCPMLIRLCQTARRASSRRTMPVRLSHPASAILPWGRARWLLVSVAICQAFGLFERFAPLADLQAPTAKALFLWGREHRGAHYISPGPASGVMQTVHR